MKTAKLQPMSLRITVFALLAFTVRSYGACPFFAYETTASMGGDGADDANAVATGADGSVVMVGRFEETIDFDPSTGVDLHSSNGNSDLFVTRFDADGAYAWTRTIGAGAYDSARAVAIDVAGAILITGTFCDTVDFDPTGGVDLHTGLALGDVFVTKLTADGDYEWTRTFGGESVDAGWCIAVANDGDVYAAGGFVGTVDFDPSEGVDEHESNEESTDMFLVKLGSDGSYEWTVTFGGEEGEFPGDMSASTDSLYLAGGFAGSVDFDPGNDEDERISNGSADSFVLKLSLDGAYQWVWTAGGAAGDLATGIAVCGEGTVAVTGFFADGPVDFDAGDGIDERSSNGLDDLFVTKLGSDGSYQWTYTAGESEDERGHGIACTSDGDFVVTGFFGSYEDLPGYTVDFDPSGGDPHATNGARDIFVTMLRSDGTYGWTHTAGGTNRDETCGIAVSENGKIFATGFFAETVDFDPGELIDNHMSNGGNDIFLTTLQCVDQPPSCDGDANGDGLVNPLDSGFVLARFGCSVGTGDPDCDVADMNSDGLVNPLDVGYILARFGTCDG